MILWTPPSNKYDLEKVKDLLLENTGEGQLIDRQEKVLLSIKWDLPAPSACEEPTTLFQTEYKNLFLTHRHEGWSPLRTDLDLVEFVEAQDDFLARHIEETVKAQELSFLQESCYHRTEPREELRQLEGVFWTRTNRDVIEKIQCLSREAPVAKLSECYHLIPI